MWCFSPTKYHVGYSNVSDSKINFVKLPFEPAEPIERSNCEQRIRHQSGNVRPPYTVVGDGLLTQHKDPPHRHRPDRHTPPRTAAVELPMQRTLVSVAERCNPRMLVVDSHLADIRLVGIHHSH